MERRLASLNLGKSMLYTAFCKAHQVFHRGGISLKCFMMVTAATFSSEEGPKLERLSPGQAPPVACQSASSFT